MMAKRLKYRFNIEIRLGTPLISQGLGTRALGLDAAILRAPDGRPALPGSLIRGNLRHAWTKFKKAAEDCGCPDPNIWLGPPADRPENYSPVRGRLRFSEFFTAIDPETEAPLRHRIKIDRNTGAVRKGSLLFIEAGHASGDTMSFVGEVDFWEEDSDEGKEQAEAVKRWIERAFNFIPALGAFKGIGFGKIKKVKLEPAKTHTCLQPDWAPGEEGSAPTALGLRLRLDRAFSFPIAHAKDNRFVSSDVHPRRSDQRRHGRTPAGVRHRTCYGGQQPVARALAEVVRTLR